MNDLLTSYIRTYVPIVVGAVLTWAARRWGIVLDEATSAQASIVAVAVVTAVYYAVVRLLEQAWPAAGRFLGAKAAPVYERPRSLTGSGWAGPTR